jgi:hypothetical protein
MTQIGEEVGLLTLIEKEAVEGKEYTNNSYYNPIQDTNANWVISTQEIDDTTNVDYLWVKELPLIEWTGYYNPSGSTINS